MGNSDPPPPPFPMALMPTNVPWDMVLWENLPLAPEKSFRWDTRAETQCILAAQHPPGAAPPSLLQVPQADAFFPLLASAYPWGRDSAEMCVVGHQSYKGPVLICLLTALSPCCDE